MDESLARKSHFSLVVPLVLCQCSGFICLIHDCYFVCFLVLWVRVAVQWCASCCWCIYSIIFLLCSFFFESLESFQTILKKKKKAVQAWFIMIFSPYISLVNESLSYRHTWKYIEKPKYSLHGFIQVILKFRRIIRTSKFSELVHWTLFGSSYFVNFLDLFRASISMQPKHISFLSLV